MQTVAAKTSAPRAARATTVRVQASLKPIHVALKSVGVAAASLALAGSALAANVKLGADSGAWGVRQRSGEGGIGVEMAELGPPPSCVGRPDRGADGSAGTSVRRSLAAVRAIAAPGRVEIIVARS